MSLLQVLQEASTLKYWLFNNTNVKSFVALRDNVKDVDVATFDSYRKMRGADLADTYFRRIKNGRNALPGLYASSGFPGIFPYSRIGRWS